MTSPDATCRCAAPRKRLWRVALAASALFAAGTVTAHETSQAATPADPNRTLSTSASLDFQINMAKFVYLQIGAAGAGISSVTFNGSAGIPGGPAVAGNGAGQAATWDGTAPVLAFTPSGASLAVEVRSNAGPVSLNSQVATPLTKGSDVIPMSQVLITSSNSGLPAPTVPATGIGPDVTVAGTAFSNLVTVQSATWTFDFSNTVSPAPGSYTGQIGFTASVP